MAATPWDTTVSLAPLPRERKTPRSDDCRGSQTCALFDVVRYLGKLIEADLSAARERDHGGCEVFDGLLAGKGADGLLTSRDLTAAAREIDIGRAYLAVHVAAVTP